MESRMKKASKKKKDIKRNNHGVVGSEKRKWKEIQ